jgi:hypothetical protein
MEMSQQTDRPRRRAVSPLVPTPGETARIEGLQAQVDDLKYTLSNVLQCLVETEVISDPERRAALVADARAALQAELRDYLD